MYAAAEDLFLIQVVWTPPMGFSTLLYLFKYLGLSPTTPTKLVKGAHERFIVINEKFTGNESMKGLWIWRYLNWIWRRSLKEWATCMHHMVQVAQNLGVYHCSWLVCWEKRVSETYLCTSGLSTLWSLWDCDGVGGPTHCSRGLKSLKGEVGEELGSRSLPSLWECSNLTALNSDFFLSKEPDTKSGTTSRRRRVDTRAAFLIQPRAIISAGSCLYPLKSDSRRQRIFWGWLTILMHVKITKNSLTFWRL